MVNFIITVKNKQCISNYKLSKDIYTNRSFLRCLVSVLYVKYLFLKMYNDLAFPNKLISP